MEYVSALSFSSTSLSWESRPSISSPTSRIRALAASASSFFPSFIMAPTLLGRRVALRLEGFGLLDEVTPERVELFESVVVPLCVAVCESGLDDIGVLTDKANVEHLSSRAKNRAFGD